MNKLFFMLSSVALAFMTQATYAQEPQVKEVGGLKLYSTPTPLWYCDSTFVGYGGEQNIHLEGSLTTVNINRNLGLDSLLSFRAKNVNILAVYQKLSTEQFNSITSLSACYPCIKNYYGDTIASWNHSGRINDLAEICTHSNAATDVKSIPSKIMKGGKYTWYDISFGDAARKSGTLVVNTPDVFYLTAEGSTYIKALEKGVQYDLIPVIRTGYPWEDRQAKYNGEVSWSFTDEYGNVMKQGSAELEHDPSQIHNEQADTLSAITITSGLGKEMYFNVTFPDASKESYTVALFDGKAAVADLGGGLFSRLEISASRKENGATEEIPFDMSLSPKTVTAALGDKCDISAVLSIQKPAYTKYEADKVATSLTGDVTITDNSGTKLITMSLGETYQNVLADMKKALGSEPLKQEYSKGSSITGCSISTAGEYKYSYNIALNGSKENIVSRSNSVIFTESATTGIEYVHAATQQLPSDNRIFTLGGTFMGTDAASLPKGIFIQNGKKIIK